MQNTTSDAHAWYVIYTKSKQEDRADSNLRAWRIETFTPKMKERRYNQFTGKPIYLTKPLFPRYIFARFDAGAMLHNVCFTRGVHNVVNFGGDPTPVGDEIINIIQSRVGKDGFVHIGEKLKSGDQVMIKDGPLKDLIGFFEEEVGESDRIRILLTTVSYQSHLTIERELVKKIDLEVTQSKRS